MTDERLKSLIMLAFPHNRDSRQVFHIMRVKCCIEVLVDATVEQDVLVLMSGLDKSSFTLTSADRETNYFHNFTLQFIRKYSTIFYFYPFTVKIKVAL